MDQLSLKLAEPAFRRHEAFWKQRLASRGDGFVGRQKEDYQQQTMRIEALLLQVFKPSDWFQNGMDFGAGYGRCLPILSQVCAHLWATELLDPLLNRCRNALPNVTALKGTWPPEFNCPKLDLLWAGLVFQHITDSAVFDGLVAELRKVLKPKAKVVILDNAVDKAPHIRLRPPEAFVAALGLKDWKARKVTINARADDHVLIEGMT